MTIFAERSERFEAWVAPMAAAAAPWRVVLGALLAAAVWVAVLVPVVWAERAAGLAPGRTGLLAFLFSFAGLIAGLFAAMRLLHGLPGGRLLGPEERLEWRRVGRGALVVAAIAAAAFVSMLMAGALVRQHGFLTWAAWLPVVLPALFLQVAGEEIAFRGYLQGLLAAWSRTRLVWWVLPALAFGALHFNPVEFGENAWLMVAAAVLMGLVFGDVTARSGSLALAIGLHFANNAFALLVMATPSQLSGFALYLSPVATDDPAGMRAAILGNMALIAAAWGVYLVIVRLRARRGGR